MNIINPNDNELSQTVRQQANTMNQVFQVLQNHALTLEQVKNQIFRFNLMIEYLMEKVGVSQDEFVPWAEARWKEIQEEANKEVERERKETLSRILEATDPGVDLG